MVTFTVDHRVIPGESVPIAREVRNKMNFLVSPFVLNFHIAFNI